MSAQNNQKYIQLKEENQQILYENKLLKAENQALRRILERRNLMLGPHAIHVPKTNEPSTIEKYHNLSYLRINI